MKNRTAACALLLSSVALCTTMASAAQRPDTNWAHYNGTINGQRYSSLTQINTDNAAKLKPVCRAKVADSGAFEPGVLEINGVLYLTTANDTLAVDAHTCKILWRNVYHPKQAIVFPVNRGVAYANGRLFRGTADSRLLAIDAKTGKTIWQEQVGDPQQSAFFSAAPLAWQGLVIIGPAGGDWGIRGHVMAFDQVSGRQVWRFNTVPTGAEPGAETWKKRGSAFRGGGATWTTYTLDAATGDLYIPVGNPAPDITPQGRPGKNLFTNAVVVLSARTGKLKWWYQLTPYDSHDQDLGAAPTLYWNSKSVPMVALASKDGHVYGVNRHTHKLVWRTAITTIKNADVVPTAKGVHVCPGPLGGTEWNGAAYDAKNAALIVPAVDWCAVLKAKKQQFRIGQFYFGGSWKFNSKGTGWLVALDPDSGKVRWRYHADAPMVAGVTPTAGGVTFTGDMDGNFLVLDSATGKLLLKSPTGASVSGGVITYRLAGTQYVALASGGAARLTFGAGGAPTIVVYALPGAN